MIVTSQRRRDVGRFQTPTIFGRCGRTRLLAVKRFGHSDVTMDRFRRPGTWGMLRDILLYHPDQIVRHEAAFVIGAVNADCAPFLIQALKFDPSIVNKHESAEALGQLTDPDLAIVGYRYLRRIFQRPELFDDGVCHRDVLNTIRLAIEALEKRFPEFKRFALR
jgi:hypothetical protein